jgi:DNA-binding Xre family transcriptional regulator
VTYLIHEQPEIVEDVLVHLAYEIRMIRFASWMSQTELSARAGLSQSTMSLIENGLAEGIRLDKVAKIAAALGCDILIRQCPHPPGISDLPTIGRVAREMDGDLYRPRGPLQVARRAPPEPGRTRRSMT